MKPRIRQQIIFFGMLSAFIPLFIGGLFSILQARKQMSEQYVSQVETAALQINSTLFDITTSLYTSSDNLLNNIYLRKLFGSDNMDINDLQYYDLISDSLQAMHTNTAAISSIKIYTDNPNIPNNHNIISVEDEYASQTWYDKKNIKLLNNWKCTSAKDSFNNPKYELYLIRRIGINSTKYTAYFVLSVDANYLKNRLSRGDYLTMASLDDEPIFYSSDRSWQQKNIPFPNDFNNSFYKYTGPIWIDNKKQLTKIVTLNPYRTFNNYYICVSDPKAYDNLNRITIIYILILIAITIFPILLTIFFSSYFNGRVLALKNAMHQVSLGDYNIMKLFKGDDELSEIFKDLNATVEKIREHEAKFYQSQIIEQQLINKQQQMEFKMLASQINPHFLYNTLETIRMQALSYGDIDVVTSIKLLGRAMHYVLENTGTDSTTLAKELEYVEVYLSIQKLRFGDRINYVIQYPENLELSKFKILPLLLQPIVENAVLHGLEPTKQNGQVIIDITYSNNQNLILQISDNGRGMDEQKLIEITERINCTSLDSTNSIGIHNINQRIKLLYGTNYGVVFTSQRNEGTRVTLTIPAILSKEA